MDIHKPQPWRDWPEFAKEIGTIVIGVLIALGAEQTVETIHRQRDRTELREALQREMDQILLDAARVETSEQAEIRWVSKAEGLLGDAYRTHRPLRSLPPSPSLDFDIPDDPIYRAAQSSGKLALLASDEREAFSELDGLVGKAGAAYDQRGAALTAATENQRQVRLHQLMGPATTSSNLSFSADLRQFVGVNSSAPDLEKLFDSTVDVELKVGRFIYWSRQVRGAATALHGGERRLRKIEVAERQFDGLP